MGAYIIGQYIFSFAGDTFRVVCFTSNFVTIELTPLGRLPYGKLYVCFMDSMCTRASPLFTAVVYLS